MWLGPEDENSKLAMKLLHQKFGPRAKKMSGEEILVQISEIELEAVAKLMEREYWQRVWIIQEIFRARRITIHCGYETVSWPRFAKFFRPAHQYLAWSDVNGKWRTLQRCCASPAKSLTQHRTSQTHCLEDLLKAYKKCRSTDSRDKVYALVGLSQKKLLQNSGLVEEEADLIEVDYSKSALDIFRTLVLAYKSTTGNGGPTPRPLHCLIQWMQLLQEVLDLRNPSDSSTIYHATKPNPSGVPRHGTGLACTGYAFYLRHTHTPMSSPPWSPLIQAYGHILEWFDSTPILDYMKVTKRNMRGFMEQVLRFVRDNDLDRLQKFENGCAESTLSVQVTLFNSVYLLLAPFPIVNGCEIVFFYRSDIGLVVSEGVVTGRALLFEFKRFHPAPVYVSHASPRNWKLKFITLSVENWARVVSLKKLSKEA